MKKAEIYFDIAENVNQRFVHLTDGENQDYLISLPKEKAEFHSDIVVFANSYFDKKLTPHGGGKVRKDGDTYHLSGKSNVLGDFNKEKVVEILKAVYPEADIILE